MAWYSELARRILPRPTPTPAGDKPPRYIFSFRHRQTVYNSERFARGEPASRLIGGHAGNGKIGPMGFRGNLTRIGVGDMDWGGRRSDLVAALGGH